MTLGVNALVAPTEIYNGGFNQTGDTDIGLRIATGGAGQSGLVKVLADAFIQSSVANGSAPFRIGWVLSDTTFTIKNLQSGEADLGISYIASAEKVAVESGIIDSKIYYLFRDHFLIVGPPENPAGINSSMDVTTLFAKLFNAADQNNATTVLPTRFLSRYDKSATNLKESQLWLDIGQVPWGAPYSTWYHQYIAFPIQALTTAITLKEYTLTDRGTLLSLPNSVFVKGEVFKAGQDDESDPLLNRGRLLLGKKAQNETLARQFAEWSVGPQGQSVVTGFKKNGTQLYSGAP
ncbi:extracellular solute-binding protein family 1 [Paraphoma chrysanthemicola]|nr:extracellular solute-binding protein family 1 [Paraphoma chrysanthemicola]